MRIFIAKGNLTRRFISAKGAAFITIETLDGPVKLSDPEQMLKAVEPLEAFSFDLECTSAVFTNKDEDGKRSDALSLTIVKAVAKPFRSA